jgi:hypothetical protein
VIAGLTIMQVWNRVGDAEEVMDKVRQDEKTVDFKARQLQIETPFLGGEQVRFKPV